MKSDSREAVDKRIIEEHESKDVRARTESLEEDKDKSTKRPRIWNDKNSQSSDNSFEDKENSAMSLSELGLVFNFYKSKEKNSDKVHFHFLPKQESTISATDIIYDTAEIFLQNIKKNLAGSNLEEQISSISNNSSYLSFPSEEVFESWRSKVFLDVIDTDFLQEQSPQKKVTIIGAGGVGLSLVDELVAYHERNRMGCEIMLLNRDTDYANRCIRDRAGKDRKVKLSAANYSSDIKDSDIIVMTSGVNASQIEADNRSDALIYNIAIVYEYAQAVKEYAPNAKVIIVTNPIEIIASLFQKMSGLPSKNIIGSGVGLDSIRYERFLSDNFEKFNIRGDIKAIVVGEHSNEGMIFLRDKITINGESISVMTERGIISKDELEKIFEESEKKTREEGFLMVDKSHATGACVTPAIATSKIVTSCLYDGNEILTAAVPYQFKSSKAYVGLISYIGLPLLFSDGQTEVKYDYLTNNEKNLLESRAEHLLGKLREIDGKGIERLLSESILRNKDLSQSKRREKMSKLLLSINAQDLEEFKDHKKSSVTSIKKLFNFAWQDVEEKVIISLKKEYQGVADEDALNYLSGVMMRIFHKDLRTQIRAENKTLTIPSSEELKNFVSTLSPSTSISSSSSSQISNSQSYQRFGK